METSLLTTIIDEQYLLEQCTPEERLTYIYALLRVGTDGVGKYSIPLEAFRLGIEASALRDILNKFEKSFVLFYYEGHIAIPNYSQTIRTALPFSDLRDDIPSHISDYFMYRMEAMGNQIARDEELGLQLGLQIAQEM